MKQTLLVLLFLSSFACAQNLTGTITDKQTGDALIGATVIIKGSSAGSSADLKGDFILPLEVPLPVTLVCTYIGYQQQEVIVTDASIRIVIKLAPQQKSLKEVNISDTRLTDKQRESPLTVEALDLIAIRETPAANFYEGLGQLKGVDLTSASIGFKVINTRGFNSTSPVRSLQIIDGIDNQSPGLNFSLGNFLGASEMDVLKVDLIAGASSAFYGPNAFNGVISMTTRSPFVNPGFEISAKTGTRDLLETSMRYSFVAKNKKGDEKLGIKVNAFFMKARDWEANNLSPTPQSRSDVKNPGGYDAVNIYGDEYSASFDATSRMVGDPGLGIYYRRGYAEKDIVDYNTMNVKLSAAAHYKVKPENEIIYSSSLGYGTTVYQGDNRYSLKNIRFYQNRLEYAKKDKFFIRVYETHENAGQSYDAYFTSLLIQRNAKSDFNWNNDYLNYYNINIQPLVMSQEGYPAPYVGYGSSYLDSLQHFLGTINDSLLLWHGLIHNYTDSYIQPGSTNATFYEPGTARFDSVLRSVTSRESFNEGGSRFYDRSMLLHVHGEYKSKINFTDVTGFLNFFNHIELTYGANFRQYRPNSRGTIFSDTSSVRIDSIFNPDNSFSRLDSVKVTKRIINSEGGAYFGFEKKMFNEKIRLNATVRGDKNENFPLLISPALSTIYMPDNNNTIRATFSSAIRNPTISDQYLYYPVGRAILVGNTEGYKDLVTVESFVNYLNTQSIDTLQYIDIDPVVPEKVKTVELGYRTTLFKHIYLDANYYYSFYEDFIGYRLAADIDTLTVQPPFSPPIKTVRFNNILRIASNATEKVTTQGFSIGVNYFFSRFYSVNGNYSFNQLNKISTDPLIPAFNTPKHKYNIGISGRDIVNNRLKNVGFNINYKWVEGFLFEGSPQFTGEIESYQLVDVQVNKKFPEQGTTIKFLVQNLLNKKHYEVYGGPLVGRLACMQITVEL